MIHFPWDLQNIPSVTSLDSYGPDLLNDYFLLRFDKP